MAPETFFEDSLFESGLGNVVVCRYKSGGRVEAGVFLVDVFCLGVKNAFFQVFSTEDFQDFLSDAFPHGIPAPRPGADGRKLVEGAVAYARSLGFAPHSDFKKGAKVFGGIDPADSEEAFTFGKNGKPFYISGPHETAERSALILDHLEDLLGQGSFDFLVSAGENPFEDAEDDDSSITAIDSEAEGNPPPS